MQVVEFTEPGAFEAAVFPLLLEREAENNLLIARIGRLASAPDPAAALRADGSRLWVVKDGDRPVASAITLASNLLVTGSTKEAIHALADGLDDRGIAISGVRGVKEAAEPFAACWHRLHPIAIRSQAQRIYQIDRIDQMPAVAGGMAVATPADLELVHRWAEEFSHEIDARSLPAIENTRSIVEAGSRFLWKDSGPVCVAGIAGPTPHGIRVNAVYTPPEYRRKGYATALVAAVTRRQLDAGRQLCFLFTDLANSTSNNIYQRIGYRPVCDFREIEFVLEGS